MALVRTAPDPLEIGPLINGAVLRQTVIRQRTDPNFDGQGVTVEPTGYLAGQEVWAALRSLPVLGVLAPPHGSILEGLKAPVTYTDQRHTSLAYPDGMQPLAIFRNTADAHGVRREVGIGFRLTRGGFPIPKDGCCRIPSESVPSYREQLGTVAITLANGVDDLGSVVTVRQYVGQLEHVALNRPRIAIAASAVPVGEQQALIGLFEHAAASVPLRQKLN